MTLRSLERLFAPRSIAIFGASSELGSISGQPLNFLVKRGDYGELGILMIAATVIGLVLPLVTVAGVRLLGLRTA